MHCYFVPALRAWASSLSCLTSSSSALHDLRQTCRRPVLPGQVLAYVQTHAEYCTQQLKSLRMVLLRCACRNLSVITNPAGCTGGAWSLSRGFAASALAPRGAAAAPSRHQTTPGFGALAYARCPRPTQPDVALVLRMHVTYITRALLCCKRLVQRVCKASLTLPALYRSIHCNVESKK